MPKALIQDVVKKMRKNTTVSAPSKSAERDLAPSSSCPICKGCGFVRMDLPVGHPDFGQVNPCSCRLKAEAFAHLDHLNRTNSGLLKNMTFSTFKPRTTAQASALKAASEYARGLDGWLLLDGERFCGKTHLAAAVCNQVVGVVPALFLSVADFLDELRFAGDNPSKIVEMLTEVKRAKLLVLDGYAGVETYQEKMFQIVNARYVQKMPTIITTRFFLDDFDGRVRSRLMDSDLVRRVSLRV